MSLEMRALMGGQRHPSVLKKRVWDKENKYVGVESESKCEDLGRAQPQEVLGSDFLVREGT